MAISTATPPATSQLTPNTRFAKLASDAAVARTAEALTANGMTVIVVDTGEQAKAEALKLIPQGTQVYTSASQTVDAIGLGAELNESGRYNSVRQSIYSMDRAKEQAEIRRMVSSHDIVVGSVHAITEAGSAIIASMGGSQLPAYAAGAGKVIWVVGTQKIVKDVDEGLQRINEYSYPLEDARAFKAYGIHSGVNKILIVNKEVRPGRITVILVKQNLGF